MTALLAEAVLAKEPGRHDPLRRAREPCRQGHRRGGRRQGAGEPRRPRVLQGPHARDGRGVRRRGVGPLLLPRLLVRRLRGDPGAARARAALSQVEDDGRAARALRRSYFISGEINSDRRRPGREDARARRALLGLRRDLARRRLRRLRRLALQRAAVQHRAASAAQPRGLHRRTRWRPAPRRSCGIIRS